MQCTETNNEQTRTSTWITKTYRTQTTPRNERYFLSFITNPLTPSQRNLTYCTSTFYVQLSNKQTYPTMLISDQDLPITTDVPDIPHRTTWRCVTWHTHTLRDVTYIITPPYSTQTDRWQILGYRCTIGQIWQHCKRMQKIMILFPQL
jgi:hypothetical protein